MPDHPKYTENPGPMVGLNRTVIYFKEAVSSEPLIWQHIIQPNLRTGEVLGQEIESELDRRAMQMFLTLVFSMCAGEIDLPNAVSKLEKLDQSAPDRIEAIKAQLPQFLDSLEHWLKLLIPQITLEQARYANDLIAGVDSTEKGQLVREAILEFKVANIQQHINTQRQNLEQALQSGSYISKHTNSDKLVLETGKGETMEISISNYIRNPAEFVKALVQLSGNLLEVYKQVFATSSFAASDLALLNRFYYKGQPNISSDVPGVDLQAQLDPNSKLQSINVFNEYLTNLVRNHINFEFVISLTDRVEMPLYMSQMLKSLPNDTRVKEVFLNLFDRKREHLLRALLSQNFDLPKPQSKQVVEPEDKKEWELFMQKVGVIIENAIQNIAITGQDISNYAFNLRRKKGVSESDKILANKLDGLADIFIDEPFSLEEQEDLYLHCQELLRVIIFYTTVVERIIHKFTNEFVDDSLSNMLLTKTSTANTMEHMVSEVLKGREA